MNPTQVIDEVLNPEAVRASSTEDVVDSIAHQNFLALPQTQRLLDHLKGYVAQQLRYLTKQHSIMTNEEVHSIVESIHTTNKIINHVNTCESLY